jgi:alkylation response protein AidB-like acyl-CoA dehydrogenase
MGNGEKMWITNAGFSNLFEDFVNIAVAAPARAPQSEQSKTLTPVRPECSL